MMSIQSVQRARHDAVRRPSQSMASSTMLFALEAPANLVRQDYDNGDEDYDNDEITSL